ncbi:nuclear transport factor 2 family protein [Nocardioides insulae]|uniref:nuclear transport factor 2 family protein n=1 Tax=Nocardioides insulae TaxID=394734 RepID=UPI0004274E3F|nr:nuclear transport factor 2 family protein [Nocardioides insulae]
MSAVTEAPDTVRRWHAAAASKDPARIPELLAQDVVFKSPAVFTPQEGIERTTAYLAAAFAVLNPTLVYQREWYAEDSAVLEFSCDLDGISVQGIDMFTWNAEGLITDFTVMVRPVKGLQKVIELMSAQLTSQAG